MKVAQILLYLSFVSPIWTADSSDELLGRIDSKAEHQFLKFGLQQVRA